MYVVSSHWHSYVQSAPPNWNALQLANNNPVVTKQGVDHLVPNHVFLVSWQLDRWSVGAYILSRRGMRQILQRTYFRNIDGADVWHLTEQDMVLADEVLYYLANQRTRQPIAGQAYPQLLYNRKRPHWLNAKESIRHSSRGPN
jgi:hypothetical protein